MLNLSDKELDRLSREAAEKFEVEQDPAAWQRLEQLLDKELGRSSPIPKFSRPGLPFFYTPALILLIGVTYFILKPTKNTTNSTSKNYSAVTGKANTARLNKDLSNPDKKSNASYPNSSASQAVNKPSGISEPLHDKNKISGIQKINETGKNGRPEEKAGTGIQTTISVEGKFPGSLVNDPKKETKSGLNGVAGKGIPKHSGVLQPGKGPIAGISREIQDGKAKNGNPVTEELIFEDNTGQNKESAINKIPQGHQPEPGKQESAEPQTVSIIGLLPVSFNTSYAVHDSILGNLKMPETGLVNLGKNKNGRHFYTNRSLQIGLLFSPDFSEVRYNYESKVGSNFGFSVSYQLTSKLGINSGLVFTSKNYTANGYDFHAPPGYWTNHVDLEFVKANCHMLEIPLNLRYDFNKAGNTTFFANVGFSSYLLKRESYDFFYHDFNFWSLRQQNEEYNTNHNYWFSVLNLSTGFETKISNSLSFQVEPYMKIPLAGIGLGKVNLSSYGIDLSIKFSPVLKHARQ